jgi:hypothetical protein
VNWFLWSLVWINVFMMWLIANGNAWLGEIGPLWRWPRPVGSPEWETDFNGFFALWCTWIATLMDVGIVVVLIRWLIAFSKAPAAV